MDIYVHNVQDTELANRVARLERNHRRLVTCHNRLAGTVTVMVLGLYLYGYYKFYKWSKSKETEEKRDE